MPLPDRRSLESDEAYRTRCEEWERKAIGVRGDLLPPEQWTVEVLSDGRAIVCVTVFEGFRQHYTVTADRVSALAA